MKNFVFLILTFGLLFFTTFKLWSSDLRKGDPVVLSHDSADKGVTTYTQDQCNPIGTGTSPQSTAVIRQHQSVRVTPEVVMFDSISVEYVKKMLADNRNYIWQNDQSVTKEWKNSKRLEAIAYLVSLIVFLVVSAVGIFSSGRNGDNITYVWFLVLMMVTIIAYLWRLPDILHVFNNYMQYNISSPF